MLRCCCDTNVRLFVDWMRIRAKWPNWFIVEFVKWTISLPFFLSTFRNSTFGFIYPSGAIKYCQMLCHHTNTENNFTQIISFSKAAHNFILDIRSINPTSEHSHTNVAQIYFFFYEYKVYASSMYNLHSIIFINVVSLSIVITSKIVVLHGI